MAVGDSMSKALEWPPHFLRPKERRRGTESPTPRDPAATWGIHYPLVDHALKRISLISVLLSMAVAVCLIAPFFYRALSADYAVWETMETGSKATILALALTSLIGSVLPFLSISGKNATLASLIADYCGGMNPLQHTGSK